VVLRTFSIPPSPESMFAALPLASDLIVTSRLYKYAVRHFNNGVNHELRWPTASRTYAKPAIPLLVVKRPLWVDAVEKRFPKSE
jgi:hypothetical protein